MSSSLDLDIHLADDEIGRLARLDCSYGQAFEWLAHLTGCAQCRSGLLRRFPIESRHILDRLHCEAETSVHIHPSAYEPALRRLRVPGRRPAAPRSLRGSVTIEPSRQGVG